MAQASVITEEIRRMLGVEVGPKVFEVEKCMIKKFADAIGDSNPLWQDDPFAEKTQYKSIIAPPTFLLSVCSLEEQIEWIMSVECCLPHFLNGGMEVESFQAVKPGDVISVTGKLVDISEREGKRFGKMLFCVLEQTYKNQKGETAAKGRFTFIRY